MLAAKFYQRASDRFHQCANRTLNVREVNVPNSGAAFEMVGQVSEKDGIISTSLLWEGGDGRNCQRGVSVRNNVVIDVSDCGYNVPDSVIAGSDETDCGQDRHGAMMIEAMSAARRADC